MQLHLMPGQIALSLHPLHAPLPSHSPPLPMSRGTLARATPAAAAPESMLYNAYFVANSSVCRSCVCVCKCVCCCCCHYCYCYCCCLSMLLPALLLSSLVALTQTLHIRRVARALHAHVPVHVHVHVSIPVPVPAHGCI